MTFDASKIIVMTTGGTIEKIYHEEHGTLDNHENKGEFIRQKILQRLRIPHSELEVYALMSKDSLQMDDSDRQIIFESIQNQIHRAFPIIILHGTDTMDLSAKYCFEKKMVCKAPVIFTGAMSPLGFENSDALQNVTEALMAAKILAPAIYLSFHNQIFKVPNVRKNKAKKSFEKSDLG